MDDNQALNDQATEAAVAAPTTETEVPKTETDEKAEVATEAQSEAEVEEGSRKTAQNRIRELANDSRAKEEKIQSLEEQIAELTRSVDQGGQPQYTPQVQPGQEISPEQYQRDVQAQADAIVNLRLQQERILNRIDKEAGESVRAHPKLDPNSGEFDRDLSQSITQASLAFARANPTQSLKKFVDGLMKPYEKSLSAAQGQAEVEVAKEQAKAALRPAQISSREKSASEMTTAELEKKLGVVS